MFQSVLKPFRCQDVFHNLWSELVFGSSPEGGKSKLSVGVHPRFFEDAFPWMEELTYKWIVQAGLPFLNQSQFEASVVSSFHENWDWSPDMQVVVFFPRAKSQFDLDKFVFGELEKLSGATVFAIQGVVHGRPNIECGLHVHNLCETKIDALGLKKICEKRLWALSVDPNKWVRLGF